MDDFNRYFKGAIENFDLSQEKRRTVNKLDEKFHEYRLNINMDNINNLVSIIIKKVRDEYTKKMIEYKENIEKAIIYARENDRPNVVVSAIDSVPKINVEPIIMGVFQDGLNRHLRRFAMESRQYEYLPREVETIFTKFVDSTNEVISLNTKMIKKHVEEIGQDLLRERKLNEALEKSAEPFPGEMIGVNFDDKKGVFWTMHNGKPVALEMSKLPKMDLDDTHYIMINKPNTNDIRIAIFENGREIKSVLISGKRTVYSGNNTMMTFNSENNTISLANGFDIEEYDIDKMNYQDRVEFEKKVKAIDDTALDYYNRVLPKKKLESLFL